MRENTLKEKIMVKAVELFSEKGYYGLRSGNSQRRWMLIAMLYYYFKNKMTYMKKLPTWSLSD